MKYFGNKWFFSFSLTGLLLSLALIYLGKGKDSISIYEKNLEKHLSQQDKRVLDYLEDGDFIDYLLKRDAVRYLNDIEQHLQKLEKLQDESFALFLSKDQNFPLVQSRLSLDKQILEAMRSNEIKEGWYDKDGIYYLLTSYELKSEVQAWAWIPALDLPANLSLSLKGNQKSQALDLKAYNTIYIAGPHQVQKNRSLLFLVIFFLLAIWLSVNHYLTMLFERANYKSFLVLLMGAFCTLLLVSIGMAGWNAQQIFGIEWSIWEPILTGIQVGPSPALMLGQSLLVLWLLMQFYRLFGHWKHNRKKAVGVKTLSLYCMSILLLTGVGYWLKYVISASKIFFNLEATLQITPQGCLVALSLVLLLLSIFLFVFRLFKWISEQGLPFTKRLLLMLLALLIVSPLAIWLQLGLAIWTWALMGFIFLMLFDLLSDGETFNFTWLMVWLIMMSAFAASLSYKYVLAKDLKTMRSYSSTLLNNRVSPREKVSELTFLDRYAYLVLENGAPVKSQQFITDIEWDQLNNLSEEQIFQNKTAQNLSIAQKQGNKLVVLQKRLGSYFSPLSLFALFFMLFFLVLLSLVGLHLFVPVLPDFLQGVFSVKHALKSRIQLAVIGIVLGSSILIGGITVWYFKSTARLEQQQVALSSMKILQQKWRSVDQLDSLQWDVRFNQADQTSYFLYNRSGQYVQGHIEAQNAPKWMPAVALESLKLQLQPYIFNQAKDQAETLFTTLKNPGGQIIAYLGIRSQQSTKQAEQQLNNFVGSIFSLYVFFMFIAGGIAIWVANSITEPISKIGASLSQIQLESNQPLVWKNEDEIGLLIQQYNLALKKLEDSSRQLRRSEREGAWREMAKQVAHEIKNPLTPMKLSVQHLVRAYQMNPESIGPLIRRVSNTLIEQIEGLTKIADEFAHFAKMPKAKPVKLQLNELLTSITDLYSSQETNTTFKLQLPPFEIFVMADKDQFMRVLHNLLTNALQAIPDDRQGQINIHLAQAAKEAKISVADNGSGIPEALQGKVFYPNFTTKSSGTGIGLSMSRNIIEQFGGQIYFETREGLGTTFYVQLESC